MYRKSVPSVRRNAKYLPRRTVVQYLDGLNGNNFRSQLPRGYPARPTPDAICGYIGDLGPFYTRTMLESRRESNLPTASGNRGETNEGRIGNDPNVRRRVRFDDKIIEQTYRQSNWEQEGQVYSWHPLPFGSHRFYKSVWICLSLGSLLLSTILLMTSFVTSSWGIMVVPGSSSNTKILENDQTSHGSSRLWYFGLWQCCRDDGLCLGLKWPAFYTATRVFAILSLFWHALTFAWMLGHTVEKLLNYDACTMMTLIANCFITSSFSLISVVCFGVLWPVEFPKMFPNTFYHLSYSYFLAVITVPLSIISGSCALVDFKGSWKAYEIREQFGSDGDSHSSDEEGTELVQELVQEVTELRNCLETEPETHEFAQKCTSV